MLRAPSPRSFPKLPAVAIGQARFDDQRDAVGAGQQGERLSQVLGRDHGVAQRGQVGRVASERIRMMFAEKCAPTILGQSVRSTIKYKTIAKRSEWPT